MLFKALRCHKGVGDARRTCRNGEELNVIGSGCRRFLCGTGRCKAVIFLIVDEFSERLDGFRLNERLLKLGIHNHGGEL